MHIEQSDKSRDLINLSILLAVALCIGIYLILTTAVISRDGTTFITYAKQLDSAFVQTIKNEAQHPGYPGLILVSHKATDFRYKNTSILSWIYCAQSIALIFRLLAITVLYFIGKHLFEARTSFWAILILIFLPNPAEYGSDALSDWPHLFFFAAGLYLLFKAGASRKWWLFGFAGLAAGAGYLIRPECAIVVMLGCLWLGFQFLWPERSIGKSRAVCALALLIAGFLAIAGPYMMLKGALFPKKNVGQFSQSSKQPDVDKQADFTLPQTTLASQFTPSNITRAFGKLFNNTGETLMWFFVPALFIGIYKKLKAQKWYEPEKFFIIAIAALYIPLMIWLHCKHGYMSDRHTLPLLIIPILYIPAGLQELSTWFQKRFSRKADSAAANRDERFWFLVLIIIGVFICIPKLFRPLGSDKQGYRAAAQWLKANTDSDAVVAVPEIRISFYAQRPGVVYENGNIPANAGYTVVIPENKKDDTVLTEPPGKVEYEYVSKSKRGVNVVIYRNL